MNIARVYRNIFKTYVCRELNLYTFASNCKEMTAQISPIVLGPYSSISISDKKQPKLSSSEQITPNLFPNSHTRNVHSLFQKQQCRNEQSLLPNSMIKFRIHRPPPPSPLPGCNVSPVKISSGVTSLKHCIHKHTLRTYKGCSL